MRAALLSLFVLLSPWSAHAGLIERLIGTEEPKLPVHQFMAAIGELERGKMTRAQLISGFVIQAAEEAELDALIARIFTVPETISLGGIVTLTNVGATYDALAISRGLGFARLEAFGITGMELVVRYDKVGTGTLSWQLWDDTTGVEIVRVDDATAAGNGRQGVNIIELANALPAGFRTIRVRAKSTVAADDPVYYGASVRVFRREYMVSEILHEILLLAELRTPPYDTPALVRTRLGLP